MRLSDLRNSRQHTTIVTEHRRNDSITQPLGTLTVKLASATFGSHANTTIDAGGNLAVMNGFADTASVTTNVGGFEFVVCWFQGNQPDRRSAEHDSTLRVTGYYRAALQW